MSPNPQTQSDPSALKDPAEGADVTDTSNREIALVKLYQNLTAEDESRARSAFMYIVQDDRESNSNLKA